MSGKICDACGLPPRDEKRKLRCCSRCRRAWYHGVHCQKRHYAKHRPFCVSAKDSGDTAGGCSGDSFGTRLERASRLVRVESREGRGRCLVANCRLPLGCRPLTAGHNDGVEVNNGEGGTSAIVPPVLVQSMRGIRCSYCFRRLPPSMSAAVDDRSRMLHRHCSPRCRDRDRHHLPETRAAASLLGRKDGAPLPSPMALLLARILSACVRHAPTRQAMDDLCFQVDDLTEKERDDYAAVVDQCRAFLLCGGGGEEASLEACRLLQCRRTSLMWASKVCLNGFTVCDGEQLSLGIGIYPAASSVNHSCRPNSVQTFRLADRPPLLLLTTCQAVDLGKELTITYCDISAPKQFRHRHLRTHYKFDCRCPHCLTPTPKNDLIVGITCSRTHCQGLIRSRESKQTVHDVDPTKHHSIPVKQHSHQCRTCGHCYDNNFINSRIEMGLELMKQINQMESSSLSITKTSIEDVDRRGKQLKQIYDSIKNKFCIESSWFVAQSADAYVHWHANALGLYSQSHSHNQQSSQPPLELLCVEALRILRESRNALQTCYGYHGDLRRLTLRAMEAKFRLFLHPMDREAFKMLVNVKDELLVFYDKEEEVILSLEESIASYMLS